MIVPLVARGRTLGATHVRLGRVRPDATTSPTSSSRRSSARAPRSRVDNARLYRDAERGRARLGFLAEASAVLGASLDVDETLVKLGSLHREAGRRLVHDPPGGGATAPVS